MNIKILVAAHKQYLMPSDPIYFPIHVGKSLAADSLPFPGDNTGDNISEKNSHYCELTALYWAWKNLQADSVGLVHYRRHFTVRKPLFPNSTNKFKAVLTEAEAAKLLEQHDILVPKRRNYYIETNYSHYVHAHGSESMDMTRQIIEQLYPEYISCFDTVMKRTGAHMFNMFLMKYPVFCDYCSWLFSILSELEKELGMTEENRRIYGFVSELLLDVYLEKNALSYKELNYLFMENEHWPKKIFNFLKRKFIS